jgi:hypothetical protein
VEHQHHHVTGFHRFRQVRGDIGVLARLDGGVADDRTGLHGRVGAVNDEPAVLAGRDRSRGHLSSRNVLVLTGDREIGGERRSADEG